MSETTIQEEPTNTTEPQESGNPSPAPEESTTTSEPAQENTAGGEESPPNTIGESIIVEKDPDQDPNEAVTSVRDGSADQTATTATQKQETTTAEQADIAPATSETSETTEATTSDSKTEAIVSVQPKDSTANNGMEATPALGLLASVPLLIAGGIKRFRHKK